jgi:DNA-binding NtrC family response regulator
MTKTRGSILLVDDEAKIRNALAEALREEGHEVTAIGNPKEAQRLLQRGGFDVLVVDNLMPELTGLDLSRELVTTIAANDRPQILMMTAHATVESALAAM